MICLRCGKPIENSEDVCRACGSRIPENYKRNFQNRNNEIRNENVHNTGTNNLNNVNNSNINNNIQSGNVVNNNQPVRMTVSNTESSKSGLNSVNNNKLRAAYIGEKYYNFTKGGPTFYPFLFGAWYTLYRKMYLFSLLWIVISMVTDKILDTGIALIVHLIINISLVISFKKIYIKHVDKKIEKIKLENPTASEETLLAICGQKGGVNKFFSVLLCIGIALFIISLIATMFIVKDTMNKAESGADARTVESYAKGLEAAYYEYMFEHQGEPPKSLYDVKDKVYGNKNVQCDSMKFINNNVVLTGCTVGEKNTKYDYDSMNGARVRN